MQRKRLKVIVVGTTFGAYYMRALKLFPDEFEFVGIVSNGSKESKACACQYGVKMYSSIDEIPKDTDLVCVTVRTTVVGGPGTFIVQEALKRGFSVIVEATMHYRDIEECCRIAEENKVFFKVGDMYSNLETSSRFIEITNQIQSEFKMPLYINLKTSVQVYFSAIRLLMKSVHGIENIEINSSVVQGPFSVITCNLYPLNIPLTIELNDEIMPGFPDAFFHLLHAMDIYYPGGRLSMTDSYGLVLWHNRMSLPKEFMRNGYKDHITYGGVVGAHSYHILGNTEDQGEIYNLRRIYEWPKAIGDELKQIKRMIEGDMDLFYQENNFDIKAAKLWSKLTEEAGYPKINKNIDCEFYEPKCVAKEDIEDGEI